MPRATARAFTLIELLVVVTVIVVLLALLAPAMDKAIYRAELTVCAARLHGIVGAVNIYAAEQRRFYPYRKGLPPTPGPLGTGSWYWQPHLLQSGSDDRPTLRPYLSINGLQCPMTGSVNQDTTGGGPIWSSYRMWWGWQYIGHSRMAKLGDRFSWTNEDGRVNFQVLVSDGDMIGEVQGPLVYSSHPDKEGVLRRTVSDQDAGASRTLIHYEGTTYRGPIDLNFGYADGSVEPLVEVAYPEVIVGNPAKSERVTWVPEDANADRSGGGTGYPGDAFRTTMPRRR